jgi:hypothetical protein
MPLAGRLMKGRFFALTLAALFVVADGAAGGLIFFTGVIDEVGLSGNAMPFAVGEAFSATFYFAGQPDSSGLFQRAITSFTVVLGDSTITGSPNGSLAVQLDVTHTIYLTKCCTRLPQIESDFASGHLTSFPIIASTPGPAVPEGGFPLRFLGFSIISVAFVRLSSSAAPHSGRTIRSIKIAAAHCSAATREGWRRIVDAIAETCAAISFLLTNC